MMPSAIPIAVPRLMTLLISSRYCTVFAVGKTGISFSNDGGKTWKDVSDEGFYAIDFVNENTAWLSGNEKIGKLDLKNQ